jgi:hypothetical protein
MRGLAGRSMDKHQMDINRFYQMADFIALVRARKDRETTYWIYVDAGTEDLTTEMPLFIGESLGFDDSDNEVLPEIVVRNGLEYGYHPEQFQDVVDLAFKQKPDASTEDVVRCLNHYAEKDDFLDLS